MKKGRRKNHVANSPQSGGCSVILAIVTEMTRRVNENISKVRLQPFDGVLPGGAAPETVEIRKA